MAAAEIQIVNPENLMKIESFLNDPSYKEVIESSSSFNSRLCAERRMRMPFIDPQTGVAQNHCNLFMSKRQRMPGAREGQVYTYPSQRWRKARRQYLAPQSRWGWSRPDPPVEHHEDSSNPPADTGDDSRDADQAHTKDDSKQDWFYDELAMDEIAELEEPEPESDEDYFDDTYANRRKRRGGTAAAVGGRGGRKPRQPEDTPTKRGRAGRGRRRAVQGTLPYEVPGDADKPFACELCGAKYKTRPGLTYHYTHTHKDKEGAGASDGDSRDTSDTPAASEYQDSYVTFLNNPAAPAAAPAPARRPTPPPRPASADTSSSDSTAPPAAAATASPAPVPPTAAAPPAVPPAGVASAPAAPAAPGAFKEGKRDADGKQASPSPYCDFCLGDDRENKKTKTPELLVSCSDCGRSGKPRPSAASTNGRPRNGLHRQSHSYSAEDFDSFVARSDLMKMLADGEERDGSKSPSDKPKSKARSPARVTRSKRTGTNNSKV